jgi:3-hydroxybutyryl-CoA dehydrogenase
MKPNLYPHEISLGVVGLGLMGSSIVVALLQAGHRVIAIAPLSDEKEQAALRIEADLYRCAEAGILSSSVEQHLARLTVSEEYSLLAECSLVLECVIEKPEIKKAVFSKICDYTTASTIIGSNTSAIPISTLQKYVRHPERFLGIHWAEPAYLTRFLEITCGEQTKPEHADWVMSLASLWGKEPTLLRKDIRGFITNRLMYAVYREIFHLLEQEKASMEDMDKAFRYDAGSWMTLMGIFRRMDYLGLEDFGEILRVSFPQLSNSDQVPAIMQKMVDTSARGTQNGIGLYEYNQNEAEEWETAFAQFNQEIYQLSLQYPLLQPLQNQ